MPTVPGNCPQIVTELMLAWNAPCDPPLPESEVVSVVEDIFTREQASHKWLTVEDYAEDNVAPFPPASRLPALSDEALALQFSSGTP